MGLFGPSIISKISKDNIEEYINVTYELQDIRKVFENVSRILYLNDIILDYHVEEMDNIETFEEKHTFFETRMIPIVAAIKKNQRFKQDLNNKIVDREAYLEMLHQ